MLAEPLVNIGSAAGLYSQIAGVLAGFAFTGLLLYLNRAPGRAMAVASVTGQQPSTEEQLTERANETAHSGVAVVLFTTLGALIICAILYGELAGGGAAEGNSFSGLFLNGPAFGAAIIGMFYATALAATPFAYLRPMLSAARVLVGIVGPSISMLLIVLAASDIDTSRCADRFGGTAAAYDRCLRTAHLDASQPYGLGLILTGALLVVSLVGWGILRSPKSPAPAVYANAMAVLIMLQAIAAVLMTAYLSVKTANYLLPDSVVRAILATTFGILFVQSVLVLRTCHHIPLVADEPQPVESELQIASQQGEDDTSEDGLGGHDGPRGTAIDHAGSVL